MNHIRGKSWKNSPAYIVVIFFHYFFPIWIGKLVFYRLQKWINKFFLKDFWIKNLFFSAKRNTLCKYVYVFLEEKSKKYNHFVIIISCDEQREKWHWYAWCFDYLLTGFFTFSISFRLWKKHFFNFPFQYLLRCEKWRFSFSRQQNGC